MVCVNAYQRYGWWFAAGFLLFSFQCRGQELTLDDSIFATNLQRQSFNVVRGICAQEATPIDVFCKRLEAEGDNPEIPGFFGALPPVFSLINHDTSAVLLSSTDFAMHRLLRGDDLEDASENEQKSRNRVSRGRAEFFVGTHGSSGSIDDEEDVTSHTYDVLNLLAGVEYRVRPGFNLIGAIGGGTMDAMPSIDTVNLMQSDDRRIALYGKLLLRSLGYLRAGYHTQRTEHEYRRSVSFLGESAVANGSYSNSSNGISLSFGHKKSVGQWSYGFHGRVLMQDIGRQQFTEQSDKSPIGVLLQNTVDIPPVRMTRLTVGGQIMRRIYSDHAIYFPMLSYAFQSDNDDGSRSVSITNEFSDDTLGDDNVEVYAVGDRNTSYQVFGIGLQVIFRNTLRLFANHQRYHRSDTIERRETVLGASMHF